ncbi:MAG TPA: hypothetical protein VFH22_10460 [Rhodocyclaceae bacterium]|nr:hypothetical protein [Rhodocyclaceae bacterium]
MKKLLFAVALSSLLPVPAFADQPVNAIGLSLDGMADTERPAGTNRENHGGRFGLEYARTIWPRLDVFAAAGGHRLRIEDGSSKTRVTVYDLRLGARQYFLPRSIETWSPFLDAALVEAWMRDPQASNGGTRRYTGWNASLGMAKLLSANTDLRLAVGYQRLSTDATRNDHTDVLSTADFRVAASARF